MRKRLTENESKTAVILQCEIKNYTLFGYIGDWNNGKTYVDLGCGVCGHRWSSTCVRTLLEGHGCPKCAKVYTIKVKTLPDSHHIALFEAASKTGTLYDYCKLDNDTWSYKCSKCSNDEYVKAGLCSGIFKTHSTNLRAGKSSCRCTKTNRWTKSQREYQIKEALKSDKNISFLGWETDSSKNNNKVILSCNIDGHGVWKPRLSKILMGQRCPKCAVSGFNPLREGCLYVIRVTSDKDDFTGFGITNSLKTRMSTHRKNFRRKGYEISEMELFYDSGSIVADIENLLKKEFMITPKNIEGFKTEATHYHMFDDVVSFVEKELEKYHG